MATLIHHLHTGIEIALAVVFLPFRGLSPLVALLVASVLSGLFMLWVFGRFSRPERIRRAKDRIRGQLLGVRLYQHDIRIVLRLQGSILRGILSYFRLSLPPLLILLIPLALILIQLNRHLYHQPIAVGKPPVVTVRMDEDSDLASILLGNSDGITVETPTLREPGQRQVSWRVRADRAGTLTLRIESGGHEFHKELIAGASWAPVSPTRTRRWIDQLLYPGEPPLPKSAPVGSIGVVYPPQRIRVFGWEAYWLVLFLVASLATVLLLKRFFGVEL